MPPFLAVPCSSSPESLPCCLPPEPPQAVRMNAAASSSDNGHALIRSVFKPTPCSCGVRVSSHLPRLRRGEPYSEPEHLEGTRRGCSRGTEDGRRPAKDYVSAQPEPLLRPHALTQHAREQAK